MARVYRTKAIYMRVQLMTTRTKIAGSNFGDDWNGQRCGARTRGGTGGNRRLAGRGADLPHRQENISTRGGVRRNRAGGMNNATELLGRSDLAPFEHRGGSDVAALDADL